MVLPGVPHHVIQRGNRRQPVFFSDDDYATYVGLIGEACALHRTAVLAWCLMPNHVHLVLVPKVGDGLRASVAEAHRRYTRHVNFREGWRGHLWQERFHSFALDAPHLYAVLRYVELNPVKAGLVERADQWRWSSAHHRVGGNDPLTHQGHRLLKGLDWPSIWASGGDAGEEALLELHSRTGRPLGGERFLDKAERVLGRRVRPMRPGPKERAEA